MRRLLDALRGRKTPGTRPNDLERAVAAWKATERTAALSEAARRRILNQSSALRQSRQIPGPVSSLFLPTSRLVLAGAVPVAIVTLILGGALLQQVGSGSDPSNHVPRVEVTKSGGEVVFLIANGKRSHRVSRSTRPDVTGEVFTSRGEFRDRLDSEAHQIIFYRID